MFAYYLRLAFKSLKRNPILSSLMVAAIALGIGSSMTTITVNYLMSANPIPEKSDVLYHVQVDSWDPQRPQHQQVDVGDNLSAIDEWKLRLRVPRFAWQCHDPQPRHLQVYFSFQLWTQ